GREHVLTSEAAFGTALRHDAGRERNEVQDVAAIERKLLYGASVDDLAQVGALGLDDGSVGLDLDRLVNVADLQSDVAANGGIDLDRDLIARMTFEPGPFDLHAVGARHQVHEAIASILIGCSFPAIAGSDVGDADSGSDDGSIRGVSDVTQDRSIKSLGR